MVNHKSTNTAGYDKARILRPLTILIAVLIAFFSPTFSNCTFHRCHTDRMRISPALEQENLIAYFSSFHRLFNRPFLLCCFLTGTFIGCVRMHPMKISAVRKGYKAWHYVGRMKHKNHEEKGSWDNLYRTHLLYTLCKEGVQYHLFPFRLQSPSL